MMKKRLALLMLAASVALVAAGCGGGGTDSTVSSAAEESEIEMPVAVAKDVEILPAATPDGTSAAEEAGEAEEAADENALIPCKSLAVAAKLAGFEMSVPQSVSGYEAGEIRANGQLIEAAYADGEGQSTPTEAACGAHCLTTIRSTTPCSRTRALHLRSRRRLSAACWGDGIG